MVKATKTPTKPICSGVWNWYCVCCKKTYMNNKSHESCYLSYCRVCEMDLLNFEDYILHTELFHADATCKKCLVTFNDIALHTKCTPLKKAIHKKASQKKASSSK